MFEALQGKGFYTSCGSVNKWLKVKMDGVDAKNYN